MKYNLIMRISTFVVLIVLMLTVANIDITLYKNILSVLGAFYLGSLVGDFARERWPLNE